MLLKEFFQSIQTPARTHAWILASHDTDDPPVDELAKALAEKIMGHRCRGAPHYFETWKQHLDGGPQPTGAAATALRAFIRPGFGLPGESQTIPRAHLEGCVAQYLWYSLCVEDITNENAVRVEHPGFSPTDPGGDGLVIHRVSSDSMMFRLWEIKKNTGNSPVSSTVGDAYQQLNSKATEYLARYTTVGQEIADPEMAEFYSRLPDLWIDATGEASAGVCVATSSNCIPNRCFSTFGRHFPRFVNPVRLMGMLTATFDFPTFTDTVRSYIWTGL
ncbi:hypothetical protein ACFLXJ_00515 [Chloroflexota bacterium]